MDEEVPQEMPQQNPYVDQQPQAYVKNMLERDSAIWQLDLKDISAYLKNILIGYEFDPETNSFKQSPNVEPIVNQKGLKAIESYMATIANRVTLLTNLPEDMVLIEAESMADALAIDLFYNRDEYDLAPERVNMLYNQLKWFMVNCVMSAKGGGFQQFMTRTHQIREVISRNDQMPGAQKKRFLFF